MTIRRRLTLLVCALIACMLAPLTAQSLSEPVTIAVLRADGIIVPIASWSGKRWENRWPVPEKSVSTPITVSDIPGGWWGKSGPVAEWHVWTLDGNRSTALIKRPSWYLAHCQQGVGLLSNAEVRVPPPPPVVQPYPKAGLASSAPLPFQPVAVMHESSPVWKAIPRTIEERVAQREDELARGYLQDGWDHPYSREERRIVDIEVESLFRTPLNGGKFLYYFEAVKRYVEDPARNPPRPGAKPCDVLTFARGWFVAGNSDTELTIDALEVRMTSCDFADVDVMLPLAYLRIDDAPLWIVQLSGWGRERFALIRFTEGKPEIVFATHGGECRRV